MTDAELLRQIVNALADGRADIAFDAGLESHMDFPGNSETDKSQFILPGLVLVALAYWRGNWWLVGASVALLAAGYWLFWRPVIRRRMRRRFIAKGMADLKAWRRCWGFPGIRLSAGVGADIGECRSPKGDWRAFAVALRPQETQGGAEMSKVK